ncbi:unnamed protein product [Sphagnum jensenii]|uniref:Helicase n=1 Tax=Sphagnum jensenii TaxID=128206 RepID=A0ABP0V6J3_9BRYO
MPTGTGKSLVIAELIRRIMQQYPYQRIVCATHRKELITQNSETLRGQWPTVPFGIYSAGLNAKQAKHSIVFAGIDSAYRYPEKFGVVNLLFIDEAHLLSPKSETKYHQFIRGLKKNSPCLKIVGFTATPYRMGQGLITDDGIFTDICYDISDYKSFNNLVADGFLATLISKRSATQVDFSELSLGADGDFNKSELEALLDTQDINYKICKEFCEYSQDRKSWLLFAAGISHAENLASILRAFGYPGSAVHSKMHVKERNAAIAAFQSGEYRFLVNNNVLTTGFNHPAVDLIGMVRPTTSTGLWVQMAGRGMRVASGKANCLLLDFGGNTARLGPINDPLIPRKKGTGKSGTPAIKICPFCGVYNHASAKHCTYCGKELPVFTQLNQTADTLDVIRTDLPLCEWFDVDRAIYTKYMPKDKPPMMRVTYICGMTTFEEYILLEHTGGILHKARKWWSERINMRNVPPTIDEALKLTKHLIVPKRIYVHTNRMHNGKNYPDIIKFEWVTK